MGMFWSIGVLVALSSLWTVSLFLSLLLRYLFVSVLVYACVYCSLSLTLSLPNVHSLLRSTAVADFKL